ncbi:PalH/RIM21-domain-containing protein [Xylaria digitata]|nr:PalH/RIM21-domain-containing protein [Xylaria digitata]
MTTTLSMSAPCAPLTFAASGVFSIVGATPTILAANAVYLPPCATATVAALAHRAIIVTGGVSTDETGSLEAPDYSDFRTPFYATIFPSCYVLAATTVLAYMLLIMLVIAPRSFLDGGVVTLGRGGFTNGHSNGITIGDRPWLQKIATLLVAVSLTIATVDTFRVAEDQYSQGYQDAHKLQTQVLGGTQLKIIQLISDTFLWLAQAQTLIRLFPRQREKIIIKWTAFALISLDVIFGALNSFQYMGSNSFKPRQFTEAVPALSYLFQLSLGLLYAAWVIYYAITKKRYAFYHPLMKNISLMATLSIVSLLVPVVFFVLDIAEPRFTGWGDYVRWVGAAAASVVVWEWVERIEALEREEKKDGVLGREVFDGDEMIDMTPSDLTWPRRRKNVRNNGNGDEGDSGGTPSSGNRDTVWPAMSSIAKRYRSRSDNSPGRMRTGTAPQASTTGRETGRFLQPPLWPSRPPPAVTPVSRTDTASADSTIYRVRYQPLTETTSRTTDDRYRPPSRGDTVASSHVDAVVEKVESTTDVPVIQLSPTTTRLDRLDPEPDKNWGSWLPRHPFHRKSRDPPAEVLPHTMPKQDTPQRDHEAFSRWDIRSRIEDFAATQAERVLQRIRPTPDTDSLPVTVIPAPPRRGAALGRLLEEERPAEGPIPSSSNSRNRDTGNTGGISRTTVSPPPRLSRSHSGATQLTRPPLSNLSDRNNVSFHVSVDRRHSGSSSDSANGDQRNTMYAERRPVDDLIQGQLQPDRPI